jgi:hypothetical protein
MILIHELCWGSNMVFNNMEMARNAVKPIINKWATT